MLYPIELRVRWRIWEDSNLRPHAYQTCALTGLSYRRLPLHAQYLLQGMHDVN